MQKKESVETNGIYWESLPNFKEKEFVCPCCKKQKMNSLTVRKIQLARTKVGKPFKVNSAWRCEKHNKKVGGVPNSAHRTGHAVDIHCTSNTLRFDMIEALINVGFTTIIVYPTFIHADTMRNVFRFLIKP